MPSSDDSRCRCGSTVTIQSTVADTNADSAGGNPPQLRRAHREAELLGELGGVCLATWKRDDDGHPCDATSQPDRPTRRHVTVDGSSVRCARRAQGVLEPTQRLLEVAAAQLDVEERIVAVDPHPHPCERCAQALELALARTL